MWWHGDLTTIQESINSAFAERKRAALQLATITDLHSVIGPECLVIRESTYQYERPSATFTFQAAFDVEHGLGVLTNGTRVLGIGYQSDVMPFAT